MKKLPFNDCWTCNGKSVTLPHDAQIGEKRSRDTSDGGHGYFPGGVYTYEKIYADEDPASAETYGIRQAPTLVVREGDTFERFVGVSAIKRKLGL